MSRSPHLYSIQPLPSGSSLTCAAPWRGARSGRVRRPLTQQSSRYASDVQTRYHVCIALVAAGHTSEVALLRSVGLGSMAALRAGSAGIARIHEHHPHPCPLGLVLHKVDELPKCPTRYHVVELLAPLF